MGINRRTIYRWVETGQLDRNLDNTAVSYANRPPVPRVCYTQVKEYVRKIRPRPPDEPVVRCETPPGHQAQVDFAEFRLPWGKRWILLVTFGYSRLLWGRFYPRQTMTNLMNGIEDAFCFFGGDHRR